MRSAQICLISIRLSVMSPRACRLQRTHKPRANSSELLNAKKDKKKQKPFVYIANHFVCLKVEHNKFVE